MPVITLLSDWQRADFHLAAIKGFILTNCPEATIVDISHQVEAFNIIQAAYILKNSFHFYPKETIHLVCVADEKDIDEDHIIIRAEHQYFIGTDNGLWGLIFDNHPEKIVKISTSDNKQDKFDTFPELAVFATAAIFIAKGGNIADLGTETDTIKKHYPLLPDFDKSTILGNVIFIDSYKNVVTNISREMFEKIGKGRKFTIYIQSNRYTIKKINRFYYETDDGELLAVFNSIGLLEIAIYRGDIAGILNLSTNTSVRINFES